MKTIQLKLPLEGYIEKGKVIYEKKPLDVIKISPLYKIMTDSFIYDNKMLLKRLRKVLRGDRFRIKEMYTRPGVSTEFLVDEEGKTSIKDTLKMLNKLSKGHFIDEICINQGYMDGKKVYAVVAMDGKSKDSHLGALELMVIDS